MKNRRTAVIGVLAAAGLALAACTTAGSPGGTATTTPPQVSAADQLTSALGKLKGQSYDVTLSEQGGVATGHGSVDASQAGATMQVKGTVQGQSLTIGATAIGTNLWVKLDLGALNAQVHLDPSKWMLVDQSKITSDDGKTFDLTGPDVFDLATLLTSVTGVTRSDATHLSGTVDLTAATGVSKPSKDDLTKAGAAAKTIPFTVTLDDQGRLVNLTIGGSVKELTEDISISNFGSPGPVTAPPAADVVPAPDLVYQILNS